MRTVLLLWLAPSALFWTWHLLAVGDLAIGRELHDEVMRRYGDMLGVDPATIPLLFAKAVATDGVLLAGILAYRRRAGIAALLRSRFRVPRGNAPVDPARLGG